MTPSNRAFTSPQTAQLSLRGYVLVPGALTPETIAAMESALSSLDSSAGAKTRRSELYGARNVFRHCPSLARLVADSPLTDLAVAALGESARPVRTLFFSKPPAANWKVAWHQDLTIAVEDRVELPGFGPWSMKSGIQHVQPPVEIVERSLALRVHIDDCSAPDGPLRVIPGSHLRGRLSPESIAEIVSNETEVVCTAARGDVLLMRPLLLHRSLPASSASSRRVLHIEYSAASLPPPLRWLACP